MNGAWASYPGAPAPGTALCPAGDVPEQGVHSIVVDGFPIILLNRNGQISAFANACPHMYLPLTYRSEGILSADGNKLICSNHDAIFDAETGEGLGGYGKGCELDMIPVSIVSGTIRIASKPDGRGL
mgnify:CR=1 FL=1